MRRLGGTALCALLLAAPACADTITRPPVEAFGSLPLVSLPRLSPDGKHIAMIQPIEGRPAVAIYTVGAPPGTPPAGVRDSTGVIDRIEWANDDRLLVIASIAGKMNGVAENWSRVISVDSAGNDPVSMFKNADARLAGGWTSTISGFDIDDPGHVFMPAVAWTTNGYRNTLFRVDVKTGNAEFLQPGNPDTVAWIMDGHGKIAGRLNQTGHPLTEHLEIPDGGRAWKEIGAYDATGGHGANVAGLTEDGAAFVRYAYSGGTMALMRLDPATGKESVLFSDPKYDVAYAIEDPRTRRVIGAAYAADKLEYRYFDPAMQNLQAGLEAAFPGQAVHAVSWDTAKDRLVVEVDGPRKPLSYFYLDRTTHQATRIAPAYPDLHEADLGEMKPYPYKARDGFEIPAYLTLPPGKAAKNLPAVVFPHGGPTARDQIDFDWMASFLANRGYAVLQPNYRGSSGYGAKFEEAGYGQWGLKMQDDLSDGVSKLVADGIADPKRICIVGASYGGYAALQGAASTPDLYACAVSFAGVSDLRKFLASRGDDYGWRSWVISAWTRYIGDRSDDADKLDAASPALHADHIKCPVLLMHGANDTTVRIDQSQTMRDALLAKGKTVRFVSFDTDNHYMELADTRIRFLRETEAFLEQNIGH
jgi:dipeptidyl aminopeptidase/acylaminoacyl peptidase